MTTFKGIRGTTIEVLSSDPTTPEEGQIWYNSSSGTLKGYQTINAWSSGGNVSTARSDLASSRNGTSSASNIFGGTTGSNTALQNTESYNGTAWTAGGNLGTGRFQLAGAGTKTASLAIGGLLAGDTAQTSATESYNGTAWTAGGNLNTTRAQDAATGLSTAALLMGGYIKSGAPLTKEGGARTCEGALGCPDLIKFTAPYDASFTY